MRAAVLSGMLALLLVTSGVAFAEQNCPECCRQSSPVFVTDWETNGVSRFDCLGCAVRAMAGRFPYSKVTVESPVSGDRITLSRVGSGWAVIPREAVAVEIGRQQGCQNWISFSNPQEFESYRKGHPELGQAQAVPMSSLAAVGREAEAPLPTARDLPAGDAQAEAAAEVLRSRLMTGYPDQTFRGGKPLSRFEMASLVSRVVERAGAHEGNLPAGFKDVPANHWAAGAVSRVASLGLMQGYPDGAFQGDQPLTRYQAAIIIQRLLPLLPPAQAERLEGAVGEPAEAAPPPPAIAPQKRPAAEKLSGPQMNPFGQSGLLLIPDGTVMGSGFAVGGGRLPGSWTAFASLGLFDRAELTINTSGLGGSRRVLGAAKYRVGEWGGFQVAAGLMDLTDQVGISGFLAGTRSFGFGKGLPRVDVTGGVAAGGLLKGLFFGASAPVRSRLWAQGEVAHFAGETSLNLGLAYQPWKRVWVKLGEANRDLVGSVYYQGAYR